MMKYAWYLFLMGLLCYACNSREKEIRQLVEEWQGKEIVFPLTLQIPERAEEMTYPNESTTKYKLFHYMDTTDCTECSLKLYEWNSLKQETDRLQLDVSFVFVAWVQDYDILERLMQMTPTDIPFFYDKDGDMEKLNRFPQGSVFRTFLLDADNKVLLVGDPLRNEKLGQLYIRRMSQ